MYYSAVAQEACVESPNGPADSVRLMSAQRASSIEAGATNTSVDPQHGQGPSCRRLSAVAKEIQLGQRTEGLLPQQRRQRSPLRSLGFPNKRLVASGQKDSGATVPSETGRGKVIRTLDPRFPKPVLYQAELYPEFRFDPLPERAKKGKSGGPLTAVTNP